MAKFIEDGSETLYVGNLDFKVTEELLYELFLQAGPLISVTIPKEKSTKKSRSFGFVCFKDKVSIPYAYYLFKDLPLFGKLLKIEPKNKRYNIPPANCVGVHSLEPKIDKNNEAAQENSGTDLPVQKESVRDLPEQEASFIDHPTHEQFASYSPQQQHINIDGQSPNSSFPTGLVQPFWMLKYNCNNNVNRTPAVDRNAMYNFKNILENSAQQHESNRTQKHECNKSNHMPNHYGNFSRTCNYQFNNIRGNESHEGDIYYGMGKFCVDKHSSQRFSEKLKFSNNVRNNSPHDNRTRKSIYNSNNSHQGKVNSSDSRHNRRHSKCNNSPRSNYNNIYNDRNCHRTNSPYYNRRFNSRLNNSQYNNGDRAHFPGKRDYYLKVLK